jgi:small conductance mechanosensitive channel
VTFISKLGIETSSFVAILGAMGLAIGLSLQGSLSNFGRNANHYFKTFKVGHTIEAQVFFATVSDIQIFVTKLVTRTTKRYLFRTEFYLMVTSLIILWKI